MALNFNLLAQEGPKNLYEGFEQGRQAVAQNALAQQKLAQEGEMMSMRRQEFQSNLESLQAERRRKAKVEKTAMFRDRILKAPTPQAARELIRMQHSDPDLGPVMQQLGSLDQDLADVPDDPTGFESWRQREAMGAAEFIKSQASERGFQDLLARVRGGQQGAAAAPASSEDRLGDFISQIEAKQNAPTPMPAVAGSALSPATNMLAPVPASTNAMAAPAGRGRTPEQIRADIDQFSMSSDPRAVRMVQTLTKEYEAALRGDQNRPLVVGNRLVSPTGQELFASPERTDTDLIRNFNAAKAQGFKGNLFDYQREIAMASRPPAPPRQEPALRTQQVTMSDGTLGIVNMDTGVITPSTVDGVPAKGKANKDLAVSEQQASYNLGRILDAAKEINAALKKDPNALKPGMGEASAASVGLSGTANVARSAQRQIVYGAQRDALDAMLYLATGAAYNKEQLEGQMAAYVPAFTDKPDAVEAKRVRMLGLIQNAKVRAGKAWTPEMDAASQALLLPVASSAKPAGGNKPPAAPGASNVTKERADANAAIAAGAPVDAVRARFKQNTGQEF
jgi:hypothetical protein